MLNYKVIVLGSLSQGDREFNIKCDRIRYERDCIVFEEQIVLIGWVTIMAVPQGMSIIELGSFILNE